MADDSLFDSVDEFYENVGFYDMSRHLTLYSNGTSTTGGFNTFSEGAGTSAPTTSPPSAVNWSFCQKKKD